MLEAKIVIDMEVWLTAQALCWCVNCFPQASRVSARGYLAASYMVLYQGSYTRHCQWQGAILPIASQYPYVYIGVCTYVLKKKTAASMLKSLSEGNTVRNKGG